MSHKLWLKKLCILLVPQIHMFLTGIYFFKFKHIYKKARSFKEPSFIFMLLRTSIESALFAVFRLDTIFAFTTYCNIILPIQIIFELLIFLSHSTAPKWFIMLINHLLIFIKQLEKIVVSYLVFWLFPNWIMLLFYQSVLVKHLFLQLSTLQAQSTNSRNLVGREKKSEENPKQPMNNLNERILKFQRKILCRPY